MDKYKDQIFSDTSGLRGKTPANANVGSSSRLAPEPVVFQAPLQINDHVYEVCKPGGRPSVEIVFFHGLRLDHLSSTDAHITTWLSKDELWLKWLCDDEHFPDARILTVSYDPGMTDMYGTCENLVHSLTGRAAQIGQDGCPVVLVGHSLGGLVMKWLCLRAHSILNMSNEYNEPLNNFLKRVKGLFFYACPHHGSKLAENNPKFQKGPLFKDWMPLSIETERGNEEFRILRKQYGWKTFGIVESEEVKLRGFKGIVVQEASARHDMDGFFTVAANHIEVSRPRYREASSFQQLLDFINRVLKEDKHFGDGLLDGLEIVGLEDSVKMVQDKFSGTQHLGIVGMGGIGKTTLAKAIFDKISWEFEYTCFFDELTSEENPHKLRAKIVTRLKNRGRDVDRSFSWKTLKGKSVLIALDDVKFASQVMVMTDVDGFSHKSRVIVTSRETKFLKAQGFDLHMIEGLNLYDSKELFCLHAFKDKVARQGFEEHVTRFVHKCKGFPLALKVSGTYLCNEGKIGLWDAAFRNLSQAKSLDGAVADGLFSVLMVSYNALAPPEQQMFLDIATCFHGQDLNEVQNAWRACSWASTSEESGWQNLVDRCLVTCSGYMCISMHEVLRDLGRKIANRSRVVIDQYSNQEGIAYNLSFETTTIDKAIELQSGTTIDGAIQLWGQEEKDTIKVLKLSSHGLYQKVYYFNFGALSGLKNLEILWLYDVIPDGHGHMRHRGRFISKWLRYVLPAEHFPPKLVSLRVTGHEYRHSRHHGESDKGITWALQKLFEIQSLRSVTLGLSEYYFKIIPKYLCLPSQLEYLQITNRSSNAIPGFGHLTRLRHFSLSCGFPELPDSFENLRALQHLTFFHCQNIQELPDSFVRLRALEHLEISACASLISLPEEFGELGKLRYLSVKRCASLKELPRSFVHLGALQDLTFYDCEQLRISLSCLHDLPVLQRLDIWGCQGVIGGWYRLAVWDDGLCWRLSELIHHRVDFPSLKELIEATSTGDVGVVVEGGSSEDTVYYRGSLASLPISVSELQKLWHLFLTGLIHEVPTVIWQNCPKLEHLTIENNSVLLELPDAIGQLHALQHLNIKSCYSLEALPKTLGMLQNLEQLTVEDCPRLKAILKSVGELKALVDLNIKGCPSLETLPNTLGMLQNLKQLTIEDCPCFTAFPESVGELKALVDFNIKGCNSLEALPDTLGMLQNLKQLSIKDCPSLEAFPESFGQLRALVKLEIEKCNYKALPDTLGQLQTLENLIISECPRLERFPTAVGQGLRHLEIKGGDCVDAFLNNLGLFQNVEKLTIAESSFLFDVRALFESISKLSRLRHLDIDFMMEALPDELGLLRHLELLRIHGCYMLTQLPESISNLSALRHFDIQGCSSLEALPNALGHLQHLELLRIHRCSSLEQLPESISSLSGLRHLDIEGCSFLEALPNALGHLQHLKLLRIHKCSSLEQLPESISSLSGLRNLDIEDCWSLEALPDELGHLRHLELLRIHKCHSLKQLPRSICELQAQEGSTLRLEISECQHLEDCSSTTPK